MLQAAVDGLNSEQLDTPYCSGGWTVRQVVHHLADSNINSYIRFKLAVTEDEPTVKTYDQDSWADLDDSREAPVEVSLKLLESLHFRWVQFLRSLAKTSLNGRSITRIRVLSAWKRILGYILGIVDTTPPILLAYDDECSGNLVQV